MRLVRFCIHPEMLVTSLTIAKRIVTYRSREEGLERVESVLKLHALSPGGGILKTWHGELRERVTSMLAINVSRFSTAECFGSKGIEI